MLTDLVQIRRMGEKKRPENERLRAYLKRHNFVERRLLRIAEEIEEQINCRQCANCCRVATVTVNDRDITALARELGMAEGILIREYTEESEEGRILKRTEAGCVFLRGNDCTVYEARPKTCREFPHLAKGPGSFLSRMWQMADRACYCPIVYNALDAFKEEVKFR